MSVPDAGAAHSRDGLCGLGHTGHQQLKQVLQHQVDQTLVTNVYGTTRSKVMRIKSTNKSTNQQIDTCTHYCFYPSTNATKSRRFQETEVHTLLLLLLLPS